MDAKKSTPVKIAQEREAWAKFYLKRAQESLREAADLKRLAKKGGADAQR